MKKFECAQCYKKCQAMVNIEPKFCLLFGDKADWHEVKEETTQQFGNSEQLPDWFRVGEYMYLPEKGKYFKITEDFMSVNLIGEKITAILAGKIKQARKRPFNDKEMKALVGETIEHENNAHIVISYATLCGYTPYLKVGEHWQTAVNLMNNNYTVNGKPCYVLEHLENGEWVE